MSENQSILAKLRDKVSGKLNRVLVTLAFAGCVNALSAKTVVGVINDVDRDFVVLQTGEGAMKVVSSSLVGAITRVYQTKNRGGDTVVKFNFDENTSQVRNGQVISSPVRYTDGISSMRYDVENIWDDANQIVHDAKNLNIGRLVRKMGEATQNYSPESFSGGTVRRIAISPEGNKVWAQYHTVDSSGHIKPQFQKGNKNNQNGYSQSSNSGYSKSKSSSGNVLDLSGTGYGPR